MTQNSPRTKKERAKISTAKEINTEIAKLYRRHANKQLSAAELKSRVGALVALRAGMADVVEPPRTGSTWTSPPTILSVPSSCFFSPEQLEAMKRGEQVIDISQCTPFVFEDEPEPKSVVPFPRLVPKAPADTLEARLGAQLDALPREELLSMTVGELMARAGVDPKHIGPDDAA